ncbi:hypothetical protein B4907_15705 [Yersinia kristensenii]|nr:hypothetical protein B4907_15705 [Yersinia kristensenii]
MGVLIPEYAPSREPLHMWQSNELYLGLEFFLQNNYALKMTELLVHEKHIFPEVSRLLLFHNQREHRVKDSY